MARVLGFLAIMGLAAALAGAPALAQDIRINPVPPHIKPNWTPVPGAPGVSYAPNLPTDVFKYQGKYYFFWENYLYSSKKPGGPWKSVTQVPAWFVQIDPAYFKTIRREAPAGVPGGSPASAPVPAPETAAPTAPPQPEQAPETAPPPGAPAGETPPPPKVM
jgi:hypothetical protein